MVARSGKTRKRLLVASVGVATVSFACSSNSDRYGTFTSGNLVAVPIEAGSEDVAASDKRTPPSPSGLPPDAGTHDAEPPDPGSSQRTAADAAPKDADAKAVGRRLIPPTGNLVPPAKTLDPR